MALKLPATTCHVQCCYPVVPSAAGFAHTKHLVCKRWPARQDSCVAPLNCCIWWMSSSGMGQFALDVGYYGLLVEWYIIASQPLSYVWIILQLSVLLYTPVSCIVLSTPFSMSLYIYTRLIITSWGTNSCLVKKSHEPNMTVACMYHSSSNCPILLSLIAYISCMSLASFQAESCVMHLTWRACWTWTCQSKRAYTSWPFGYFQLLDCVKLVSSNELCSCVHKQPGCGINDRDEWQLRLNCTQDVEAQTSLGLPTLLIRTLWSDNQIEPPAATVSYCQQIGAMHASCIGRLPIPGTQLILQLHAVLSPQNDSAGVQAW